ncbi:hypothetical protein INT43_005992 [Umbelopsis isabellina]|uniref:Uncharacterized protein n=1 Tax=Mortierella isabellina TaxID=91625 RepID=A0A8H7PJK5_MORIS|nr:hypothetical protein INT43_005992 [Umbelopsis isabellina]
MRKARSPTTILDLCASAACIEGLSDQEADKISYWADWAELNAVAPPQPPRPPPNFNYQYPTNNTDTDSSSDRKAKL